MRLAEIRTARHCLASLLSPLPAPSTPLTHSNHYRWQPYYRFFFFFSCFCLFKKEIQKTKCLKRSSRNMLKIRSKRISKHTDTHRYVFTYENMYIYIIFEVFIHLWLLFCTFQQRVDNFIGSQFSSLIS